MKGNDYLEKSASVILPKPSKIIIIEEMKKVINRRRLAKTKETRILKELRDPYD